MIDSKTLTFLKGIKQNNDKAWYEENKAAYKVARLQFTDLMNSFALEVAKFDSAVAKAMKQGKTVVKVFRIHRDARFSHNKAKYKTNLSGFVAADTKSPSEPAYYLSVEPGGGSFFGGGIHSPERLVLNAIRDKIEVRPKDLFKVEKNPDFSKYFKIDRTGSLKVAPRGYDPEHEAIEYLRLKSFTAGFALSDTELKNPKLMDELIQPAKGLYQLVKFLRP